MFICGFYKITIVQKGDPKKEDDAPIYVFAPHTSLFDVLAGIAFDAPSSVAKADILDIPLFGSKFMTVKYLTDCLLKIASRRVQNNRSSFGRKELQRFSSQRLPSSWKNNQI